MRYDAAIIGASHDGLAAAIALAASGLRAVVIERAEAPGAELALHAFHPGFKACLFRDDIAPIPPEICWAFGLARHGIVAAPDETSLALWPDGESLLSGDGDAAAGLTQAARAKTAAALARAAASAEGWRLRLAFWHTRPEWHDEEWADASLAELVASHIDDPRQVGHVMAATLTGRTADPFLAGSALHLLAQGGTLTAAGPARLPRILGRLARATGVELICGTEVARLVRGKRGIDTVLLGDGRELETRAVISTRDLKQTFLSFFAWNELPSEAIGRVRNFRMGGGTARVLFALDAPPDLPAEQARVPIHVAPTPERLASAHTSWRAGVIPDAPPTVLRIVSASDPSLAPVGKAVMTATLSGIPYRLFDGGWTRAKRDTLRDLALKAAGEVFPGLDARIIATHVVAPPEFEDALGVTEGDLWGGEIAADQMNGMRPWFDGSAPRSPLAGLYLAGPSTAAGVAASCASGLYAARAVIADLKTGRLA